MYRLSLIISEIYNKYLPLAEQEGIVLNLDFSDTTKEISNPERVKADLDKHLGETLKQSNRGEVTVSVDKDSIKITDSSTTLSHTACALLSNRYIQVQSRVGFGTTVTISLKPQEMPSERTLEDKPKRPTIKIGNVGITADFNPSAQGSTLTSQVTVSAKRGKQSGDISAGVKLTGRKSTKSTDVKLESKTTKAKLEDKTAKTIATKRKPSLATKVSSRIKQAKVKSPAKTTTKVNTKKKSATSKELAAAARKADKEMKRLAKKVSKQSKKLAKSTKKELTRTAGKVKKKAKKKLEVS